MQFFPNGPDIPLELIKSLEDDKLVFFCGAGISYLKNKPAFGSFYKLLSEVSKQVNFEGDFSNTEIEVAFEMLEDAVGKKSVDGSIRKILTLNKRSTKKLDYHQTMLKLSCSVKRKSPRLVTTNFDNCFDRASISCGLSDSTVYHYANALPVPDSAWSSIVHLHGKADILHSELIYSQTAFAKAYLGNQWATSFIMELFEQYTVVFVGYSMQDPIIRYGVQALRFEKKPYIFIPENEVDKISDLNLQVIPFTDYLGLWKSLYRWAEMHEQGIDAWITYAIKELVKNYPIGLDWPPETESTVKNLTEILSNSHRAKRLSNDLPIQWLQTFIRIDTEKERFKKYFNVLYPDSNTSPFLYGRIVNSFYDNRPLHPVTAALIEWMIGNITHLDNSVLKHIIENGCILHQDLICRFRLAIKKLRQKLLSDLQIMAWEIILYHVEPTQNSYIDLNFSEGDFSNKLIVSNLKKRLLKKLKPRLRVRKPYTYNADPKTLNELLDINIEIHNFNSSPGLLSKLQNDYPQVLSSIFDSLEGNLHEVVRLSTLFQDEEYLNIEENFSAKNDNYKFNNWTIILKWLWASFNTLDKKGRKRAISRWSKYDSLLFKRLALQAYNRT